MSIDVLKKVVRGTARLMGLFIVGLVLLILIGEGGFNPVKLTRAESILMVFFWTTWLGLIVAWRWEMVGGAMAALGMLLFYFVHLFVAGRFPRGWAFLIMAFPGILYMLSWLLEKHRLHYEAPALKGR